MVFPEESFCLCLASIIQAAVDTATLHNAPKVKVSLPVTNEINFFAVQFPLFSLPYTRQTGAIIANHCHLIANHGRRFKNKTLGLAVRSN